MTTEESGKALAGRFGRFSVQDVMSFLQMVTVSGALEVDSSRAGPIDGRGRKLAE